ncbi:dipeptidase PepV [Apilactobacillus xinyiensis]|uniref:dipeptidase PepV n=1 Tax=Apilactobacillus xinyiensis TaxID=2841032 RepID=UPI00200F0097|nr:dipeptidase PepV [Apilactobacillus xinyiensis]MCL0329550.1 dipeptidase PepV [Apilactobacillus xinyiensis]
MNWKEESKKYKDAYLEDLKALIAIDSERDDEHGIEEFPLGKGPAMALKKYLEFGQRDGFKVKNLDNIVGYIEYGEGDQTLAILAHADVMPAGEGWHTDPFSMTIKDGKVYGRGASDDKGPGLAAYYGLKMLKDNNVKPNCKIRFIIGTDEESEWTGMKHYFDVEPAPDFGFSPDAEFPLINGEKGNTSFTIKFDGIKIDDSKPSLTKFESGLRENMVPRDAFATLTGVSDADKIIADFDKFISNMPVEGDIASKNGNLDIHVVGKSAHGMEPKNGINGGTYLANFISNYQLDKTSSQFIKFISEYLHDDSRAHKLGVNYVDDIMGELTMNVGIVKFDAESGGFINTNFRYPKGVSVDEINHNLQLCAEKFDGSVENISNMNPHYVDPSDPIVDKLMSVYRDQTGRTDSNPEVVGGGTYGRMMPRGVAFGALFPWTEDTMHQADEFQPVDDLILAMSIYGQSIYKLSCE